MDKRDILKRSDLFKHLEDYHIGTLSELCREEVFDAGETVFRQGEEADRIYVVAEGLISVLLELGPTDKRQIQAASNHECFGWAAIIPPYRRLCTAKAIECSKTFSFNGQEIRRLYFTNPRLYAGIAAGVACVMSKRLKSAYDQIVGITYQ